MDQEPPPPGANYAALAVLFGVMIIGIVVGQLLK